MLSVDLRDGIGGSADLATDLIAQARSQHAGGAKALSRRLIQRVRDVANASAVDPANLAEGLDAEEVAALEGLLAAVRAGRTSLHEALKILHEDGSEHARRVIVFIDEIQEIGRWSDTAAVLTEIAVAAKRAESHISFVLTGSEVSMVRALFEPEGAPLLGVVRPFPMPEIHDDRWHEGLTQRYDECGLEIGREQIRMILAASDGHPLKTMLICRETLDWLSGDETLSDETIRQAIVVARSNPEWSRL